ncbi:MAG: hypothetical protein ACI83W_000876 [Marinoscillum sp.]|jgi:hypothetical protein
MKRVLIIIGVTLVTLLTAIFVFIQLQRNPLPPTQEGKEAEALADKMLNALGFEAYKTIDRISWSFPRGHHYVWDKSQDSVLVKWDDYEVKFRTTTLDGWATLADARLSGEQLKEVLVEAWSMFANDSFWLVAPFKIRDPGTSRGYVKLEEGEALLVSYSSGGVTPGDSYLWIFDETGRPKAWRLWTQKIPISGIEFSWHGWQEQKGAWFAPLHQGVVAIDLKNLKVE